MQFSSLRVLVIDAWMPTPDRDGASHRVINLLAALDSLCEEVTFGFSDSPAWREADDEGYQSPFPSMKTLRGDAAVQAHLEEHGARYDVVFLSRLATATKYLEIVRDKAANAAVVFDTTDLHFLRGFRGAKVTGKINLMKSALLAKRDEIEAIKRSDCTLVVSTVEQELLATETPDSMVRIVSLIMDDLPGAQASQQERTDALFVGGFELHPNEDAMEQFIGQTLPLVREKLPELPVNIVGALPPQWLQDAAGNGLRVSGQIPDLRPVWERSRLSIAPLRYGAGVKTKVLLSMANGVPPVISSIAAEGIPIEHGKHALIADEPAAFADALVELYRNETLWSAMSKHGHALVSERFSLEAARRALEGVFGDLGLCDEPSERTA